MVTGYPYGNYYHLGIFSRIPKLKQSPYGNGLVTELSPYGNGYPLPYGDPHMVTGMCFIAIPIWKRGSPYGNGDAQGMWRSPLPYGDYPLPYGDPHMVTTESGRCGRVV